MDSRSEMMAFIGDRDWKEIPCILKRLYSDFIVVEIPTPGNTLKVQMKDCDEIVEELDATNDLKRPLASSEEEDIVAAKKVKTVDGESVCISEANGEGDAGAKVEAAAEKMPEDDSKHPIIFTDDDLLKIEEVVNGKLDSHTVVVESFSKPERKLGHRYLREKYGNSLTTNCVNGKMELRCWQKNSAADPRGQERPVDRFPKGHNLFFTLTKENKETSFTIDILAKLTGLRPSQFSVAGTKDRRAVTTQLVCATNVAKGRVQRAASKLRGFWIDNFHYTPRKLQLGSLWGNHFEIVLRNLDLADAGGKEELGKRIAAWSHTGFLNYFGAQRFGTCGVNTAEVGRLILAGEWERVVLTILSPRNEAFAGFGKCFQKYRATKNPEQAIKELKQQAQRLNVYRLLDTLEGRLLVSLQKNGNNFKDAVINMPRDVRSLYVHAYQSLVFNKVLTRRCKKFGMQVIEGDLNSKGEKIESIQDASLTDVYLPLPSFIENYPENEVGEWYREIAKADGLTQKSFEGLEKNFVLGDIYRPIVVKPLNVDWEVLSYTDDLCILQESPFVPANERKRHSAHNSNQTAETDEANEDDEGGISSFAVKCENADAVKDVSPAEKSKNSEAERVKQALRIKFDLPACCYATVALRELLRIDFSKSAQKKREGVPARTDDDEAANKPSMIKDEVAEMVCDIDGNCGV